MTEIFFFFFEIHNWIFATKRVLKDISESQLNTLILLLGT